MSLEFLNVSVVVLAQQHNPMILHPYFLEREEIVPEGWLLAEPLMCTPPIAIVKYRNGIVFTVETGKLNVTDHNLPANPLDSLAGELATKYVAKLPHVKFTAVGINFTGFLRSDDPEGNIVSRFIKDGPWDQGMPLKNAGLSLGFEAQPGRLTLKLDAGEVRRPKEGKIPAVVINANYHQDVGGDSLVEAVEQAIDLFSNRCKHFVATVDSLFELEN